MRGFNKVILMGNLTRDPDLRYTVNRRAYVRFSVAVNYSYKNQNGELQQGADYINVVAWGQMAENCGRYLKKGSGVLVEGKLRTSSYEARDGSGKRFTTEVLADGVQFVGGRREENNGDYQGGGYQQSSGYQQGGGYRQNSGYQQPASSSFNDANFGQSIQDKGFGDDFPMNFSDPAMDIPPLGNQGGGDRDGEIDETDIPF